MVCTDSRPYVCSHEQSNEFGSTKKYPTWNLLPGVVCPEGWIPYHSACYKLFMTPKSFANAQKACKGELDNLPGALYSDLFTIWDDYEMAFGHSFFRDDQITGEGSKIWQIFELILSIWAKIVYLNRFWPKESLF